RPARRAGAERAAFEHGHPEPPARQVEREGGALHAGPDDDRVARLCRHPRAIVAGERLRWAPPNVTRAARVSVGHLGGGQRSWGGWGGVPAFPGERQALLRLRVGAAATSSRSSRLARVRRPARAGAVSSASPSRSVFDLRLLPPSTATSRPSFVPASASSRRF